MFTLKNLTLGPKIQLAYLKNLTLGSKIQLAYVKNLTLWSKIQPAYVQIWHYVQECLFFQDFGFDSRSSKKTSFIGLHSLLQIGGHPPWWSMHEFFICKNCWSMHDFFPFMKLWYRTEFFIWKIVVGQCFFFFHLPNYWSMLLFFHLNLNLAKKKIHLPNCWWIFSFAKFLVTCTYFHDQKLLVTTWFFSICKKNCWSMHDYYFILYGIVISRTTRWQQKGSLNVLE